MEKQLELGKKLINVFILDYCGYSCDIVLEDDFYQEVGRLTMDILGSNMMEINDTTIHSLATGNVINKLLDNNINIYQNYWETLPELKQFEEMINDVMNIVECQD